MPPDVWTAARGGAGDDPGSTAYRRAAAAQAQDARSAVRHARGRIDPPSGLSVARIVVTHSQYRKRRATFNRPEADHESVIRGRRPAGLHLAPALQALVQDERVGDRHEAHDQDPDDRQPAGHAEEYRHDPEH